MKFAVFPNLFLFEKIKTKEVNFTKNQNEKAAFWS